MTLASYITNIIVTTSAEFSAVPPLSMHVKKQCSKASLELHSTV